ncbi:MAG TPA: DUF1846 domain-containing protein [Candidatus Avoscillospira avicola]|uniref:DUF1846 domain-containing protein n=1 Tax=Candidatus Avoscillospira avicola TaxID=2840706 RepID=A0A9D1IXY4_9FIRM|nr:DUF1846 domain-containing protein [Candidatus Avoscillospira avicola]
MTVQQIGFDNDKYLTLQTERILSRVEQFGGKLYLEFGGKLFDDYHASRVLPGFQPDSKMRMLLKLRDQAELVVAISADDIEKSKRRGDLGITYDMDVMRLIDAFREFGLYVGSVVMTRFRGQHNAEVFQHKLEAMGIRVYRHYPIDDYPSNIPLIVSDEGFGKNDYIETTRPIVVITAPGPGSGKMATCLSQLYQEHCRGIRAGYAKYETFPVWNLPLKHPVNLAYEAATVDLDDVNMIDPFHLEAYGETTVNYNRDIEIFPVLEAMFRKIYGHCPYKSPTDMGVNMAGYAIVDDEICREASRQEIIRRYFSTACAVKRGVAAPAQLHKMEVLMQSLGLEPEMRPAVPAARAVAQRTGEPAMAIELSDGTVITGKTSALMGASCAAMLNALKHLAGIADQVDLISPTVLAPIQHLKVEHLGNRNPRLHTDEMLIALSMCAVTNPTAELAMEALSRLRDAQVHSTVILSPVDETVFKKLGAQVTYEPVYESQRLYHKS